MTEIVIPDSVASIGSYAFSGCSSVQNITIGDSVTSIGKQAFNCCSGLTFITIGDSVTSIGDYAFLNCSSLTSITIGDGVTSIGDSAFDGCSSMTGVYISDIAAWCNVAFSSSYSNPLSHAHNLYLNGVLVTELVIPDSVTAIPQYAFYHCSSLTSITISDSVTSIGFGAFSVCDSLSNIQVDAGNTVFHSVGNCLIQTDSKTLIAGCKNSEIPTDGSVTSIGDDVFSGCSSLTSITIPDSVTSIGSRTFARCSSLTSIIIGDSVTSIGSHTFFGCSSLTSIIIPDSVTSIGDYAFLDCSNLTSITIPDSVTSIGYGAFSGCNSLTGVYISDIAAWCNIAFGGYASNPLDYAHNLYLNGVLVTELVIADSVTSIGDGAFSGCSSLTSITIPDSVTSIGEEAFFDCSSLTSVTIGDSVTSIGEQAFRGCSSLTSIIIPDSVTSIGSWTFSGCSSLTSITIPFVGDSRKTSSDTYQYPFGYIFGSSSYTGGVATRQYYHGSSTSSTTISTYYIPSGLKSVTVTGGNILYGAFHNCSSLTSIIIPDSVTSIGEEAFRSCSGLTSITIPDSVTSIGYGAFFGCSNLNHVAYTGTQSQWDQISISSSNSNLTNATRHYETRFQTIDTCVESGVYCPVCETYLQYTPKEPAIHNYDSWVTTTPATFTSVGQQEKTCTLCGDTVIESIDMLVGNVYQYNIVLEDDYAVNFYLQVSESIENTAKVQLTIGNETVSYNVSALNKNEDGYFLLTANISAAQMNDFITVMVMNGREIGCNNTYTAREYCDTILSDASYSQYHAVVNEMLNYGAMAQVYFDHNAENLSNDGITGVAREEVPETTDELSVNGSAGSAMFYGASLVYRDRIAVRYYFTGDATGCTFTANGNAYAPVAKDGMYYVEIADIMPQNLNQQITLTVTDSEGNTLAVCYGPMNYIVRMNKKGSEAAKNLLKALYNYHLAAKALRDAV